MYALCLVFGCCPGLKLGGDQERMMSASLSLASDEELLSAFEELTSVFEEVLGADERGGGVDEELMGEPPFFATMLEVTDNEILSLTK
mmetsp:Transcript_53998/g.128330  ORF Transcript_53998/g.128330 Transcript_53998/m.128330 type:complete len:88 (-) Transcript_53998:214-477(-)